jgi:hypothetical protein
MRILARRDCCRASHTRPLSATASTAMPLRSLQDTQLCVIDPSMLALADRGGSPRWHRLAISIILININLFNLKIILLCVGMPSKEAGARGVQVAVPPLSGHAPHTVEAPGSRRLAPAPHPCVPLSLRLVWVSVQALQPPRALEPRGLPSLA